MLPLIIMELAIIRKLKFIVSYGFIRLKLCEICRLKQNFINVATHFWFLSLAFKRSGCVASAPSKARHC